MKKGGLRCPFSSIFGSNPSPQPLWGGVGRRNWKAVVGWAPLMVSFPLIIPSHRCLCCWYQKPCGCTVVQMRNERGTSPLFFGRFSPFHLWPTLLPSFPVVMLGSIPAPDSVTVSADILWWPPHRPSSLRDRVKSPSSRPNTKLALPHTYCVASYWIFGLSSLVLAAQQHTNPHPYKFCCKKVFFRAKVCKEVSFPPPQLLGREIFIWRFLSGHKGECFVTMGTGENKGFVVRISSEGAP